MPVYKISDKSATSLKSELELFEVPPTQTSVVETIPVELLPLSVLTDTGPYDFRVPSDNLMLDVYHNELYIRLKIVDNTEANLVADANGNHPAVGPINLLAKTFFNHVKLFINGKLIEDSSDKYSYRAFLETELNFGYDAKDSHLKASGYKADTVPHMNDGLNVLI